SRSTWWRGWRWPPLARTAAPARSAPRWTRRSTPPGAPSTRRARWRSTAPPRRCSTARPRPSSGWRARRPAAAGCWGRGAGRGRQVEAAVEHDGRWDDEQATLALLLLGQAEPPTYDEPGPAAAAWLGWLAAQSGPDPDDLAAYFGDEPVALPSPEKGRALMEA